MASTTPNFGLRKPASSDHPNVATDISANMDLLDAHGHSGTYVPIPASGLVPLFVTTGGSDSNDGRSWGTAFLTVAAAIAALPASGGIINVGAGTFNYSTALNLDGKRSITIQGLTAPSAGASMASVLTYTASGSASAISAQNSVGVQFKNLALLYSHASYTGRLLDYRNVSGLDTAFGLVENCYLGGASVSGASALIALDKCNDTQIRNCHLADADVHIMGKSIEANYANGIAITNCTFHRATTMTIKNPSLAWLISNCVFEGLTGGTAGAVGHATGVTAEALTIQSCWTGDTTGGTQFKVCGKGITIAGNWIGATSGVGVDLDETATGVYVTGNAFVGCTDAVRTIQPSGDSNSLGWVINGNTYTTVTNKLTGGLAAGSIHHDGAAQGSNTGLKLYGANFNGRIDILDGSNINLGGSSGTKIGTATTQKVAFFNATPVVQRPSTTDIRQALIDLGLLASGGATPLDLNGGRATTAGVEAVGSQVPRTIDPRGLSSASALTANQGIYLRVQGGGSISKIGLVVGTSSGNVCVAVYANSGVGAAARPAARKATSGSVACPAANYQEISLGGSVTVLDGDWFFIAADNATATFYRGTTAGTSFAIANGMSHFQNTAFPAPDPAVPSATGVIFSVVLVGVV